MFFLSKQTSRDLLSSYLVPYFQVGAYSVCDWVSVYMIYDTVFISGSLVYHVRHVHTWTLRNRHDYSCRIWDDLGFWVCTQKGNTDTPMIVVLMGQINNAWDSCLAHYYFQRQLIWAANCSTFGVQPADTMASSCT